MGELVIGEVVLGKYIWKSCVGKVVLDSWGSFVREFVLGKLVWGSSLGETT